MTTPPTFSVGQTLASSVMNQVGLWKIASYTFANNTAPYIDSCFSADYDNYKVIINVTSTSNAQAPFVFRAGGADVTTSSYYWGGFYIPMSGGASVIAENSGGAIANARWGAYGVNGQSFGEITVSMPYSNTQKTNYTSVHQGAEPYARYMAGTFDNTTRFDGIKIYGATLTGSITVFGIHKP